MIGLEKQRFANDMIQREGHKDADGGEAKSNKWMQFHTCIQNKALATLYNSADEKFEPIFAGFCRQSVSALSCIRVPLDSILIT